MFSSLLFFLLLLLSTLLFVSSSKGDSEYEEWLSWNIKNYKTKSQVGAKAVDTATEDVDTKLQRAELYKIRLSVCQDGSCDFESIGEAIDSIPVNNTIRVILAIQPGVYREKIVIQKVKPFITFLGDSNNPPVISGNDTAAASGQNGVPLNTFQSATVAVNAHYFTAINIKFENTARHDGSTGQQAVALRISGNKAAFYNCSFYGIQDTLYDHRGLHYFNNCFIQGSVDFIFGYGRSLYENCHLNSIAKKVSSITAQRRSNVSLSSGFSFKNSVITGSGKVFLGRAWGDQSRVVFSYTFMDKIVVPQGWSSWGDQTRQQSVYYGEYKCSGPGADISRRVSWARVLNDTEAQPFLGTYYVDGDSWILPP